jgi:hypothetical protein
MHSVLVVSVVLVYCGQLVAVRHRSSGLFRFFHGDLIAYAWFVADLPSGS